MKKTYLEVTPEIHLYYPNLEFSTKLFALIDSQRDYLRTWMPWADSVVCEADITRVLKENIRYNIGKQKLTTYIYVNDEPAGSVALVRIDKEHKKAEIGYWLREDMQGQGIMTQSIKRLMHYVFKTMDINRIYMKVPAGNVPSNLTPNRLGFHYEGTLRQDAVINDAYHDMKVYGILKEDWKEKYAKTPFQ